MMDIHNSPDMNPLSLICVDAEGSDGSICVDCDTIDANDTSMCTVSIMNFCNQYYTTSATEKMTMPEKCICDTDNGPCDESCKSESTSENVTIINGFSFSNSSNSTIVAALGALVTLLLVLLVIVTTCLAWTCWLLKKRGGVKFSSESQMR